MHWDKPPDLTKSLTFQEALNKYEWGTTLYEVVLVFIQYININYAYFCKITPPFIVKSIIYQGIFRISWLFLSMLIYAYTIASTSSMFQQFTLFI